MAQAMGLPGEDDLEYQRIERRRRMADALAQSSQEPIQAQQTGMFASTISPFQGAAKMLSAYLAGRGQDRADKDQRSLIQDRNNRTRNALADAMMNGFKPIRQEIPGQPMMQPDAIGGDMPALRRDTNNMVAGADLAGIRPPQPQPSPQGPFAATPDPSAMPQPGLPPRVASTMQDSMFEQVRPNAEGQVEIKAPGVGATAMSPSTFKEVPRTIQQSLAYITQLEQDNNLPPGTLLNNQSISMLLSQQMEANKPQKLSEGDAIMNPDGSVRMERRKPVTPTFQKVPGKDGREVLTAINPQTLEMTPIGGPAPQDVNKPFLIGPNGEPVPNAAYQAYAQQTAKAGAANVNQFNNQKDNFKNERDLRNDFKSEPIYKAHQEVRSAYGQIGKSIAMASPAGDLAAATKIMKLLDPTSVVRESELQMAIAANGLEDRLGSLAQRIVTGQKLTPKQRQDFGALAKELFTVSESMYNEKANEYKGIATDYGLNAGRVGGKAPAFNLPPGWTIEERK